MNAVETVQRWQRNQTSRRLQFGHGDECRGDNRVRLTRRRFGWRFNSATAMNAVETCGGLGAWSAAHKLQFGHGDECRGDGKPFVVTSNLSLGFNSATAMNAVETGDYLSRFRWVMAASIRPRR